MSGLIIAVLCVIVAVLFVVAYFLNEARKKHFKAVKELTETINSMDEYIKESEKIDKKKDTLIEKISTGSDSDRFDSSLGVLSDIAKNRGRNTGS